MDLALAAFWAKKIVGAFVLLPIAPMLVIVVGALLARRHRHLGRFLVGLGVTVLVVFALPVVANALAAIDERQFPPLDASLPLPPKAAIVVLAGGVERGAIDYGGETVNAVTLTRLRAGARLATRTGLPVLVTGGPLPSSHRSEADLMSDVLTTDFKLPPPRWKEGSSYDTADNARLSTVLLRRDGIETVVLVTDVNHMRRARLAFESAGMRVICAPTNYVGGSPVNLLSFFPNAGALRQANWTLYEWLGTWWMRMHS
jgi:uncharacterized SAM-binding protein YcdF (DUF218 family)